MDGPGGYGGLVASRWRPWVNIQISRTPAQVPEIRVRIAIPIQKSRGERTTKVKGVVNELPASPSSPKLCAKTAGLRIALDSGSGLKIRP